MIPIFRKEDIPVVIPKPEEMKDIIDIEGIYAIPWDSIVFWLAIAGGLLVFGLIIWAVIKYLKRKSAKALKPVDPVTELSVRLLKCKALDFNSLEIQREHYFIFSELLRLCLEKIAPLKFPEKTSDEVKQLLNTDEELHPFASDELYQFMKRSDLVNFASRQQSAADLQLDIKTLEVFLEKIKTKLKDKKADDKTPIS